MRRWGSTALVVGAVFYFAGHALLGNQGALAWVGYKARIASIEADINALELRRSALEARAERLRIDTLDLDFLDERARALLGLAHPGDIVVPAAALPRAYAQHFVDRAGNAS